MLEIYKFNAMTTPCQVQLYCDKKEVSDMCAKEILHECKRLESKYNYFDSNSFLSLLNKREVNILDQETKTLLSRAKQYYKKTDGIFDITMATIKEIYTNTVTIEELKKKKEKLLKYVGCEHFDIKRDKLYFDNDFTKIDLGGFVKEYSVDRAVNIIKKHKVKSALVNFGGDIFAVGKKPDGTKYKIGITNPKSKDEKLFNVSIENQALTTSASYERYEQIEDVNFSHILSKDEIKSDIVSATIVSNNCVESGVYSTSLMCDSSLKTIHQKHLINDKLEVII